MKARNDWTKGVKTAYNPASRPTYYVTEQNAKEVKMCLNCTEEKCKGNCSKIKNIRLRSKEG